MDGSATIELEHTSATTMAKDAIINSRDVREESVGSYDLVETRDVGGRKPGLEVFS